MRIMVLLNQRCSYSLESMPCDLPQTLFDDTDSSDLIAYGATADCFQSRALRASDLCKILPRRLCKLGNGNRCLDSAMSIRNITMLLI